jgi:hypothetical protein
MSKPVALILGAGPGIGQSVARAFASKGYSVAVASRTAKEVQSDQQHITVDLSKPEAVPGVFETVREKLGSAPGVVVYNGKPLCNVVLWLVWSTHEETEPPWPAKFEVYLTGLQRHSCVRTTRRISYRRSVVRTMNRPPTLMSLLHSSQRSPPWRGFAPSMPRHPRLSSTPATH